MKRLRLLLIQLLIFLILGEVATRLIVPEPDFKTSRTIHHGTARESQLLGWEAAPNYDTTRMVEQLDGSQRAVHYSNAANGFRTFGQIPADSLKKVLFIGDSFTQAVEVSDDETYYQRMKQLLPMEVFAYGMAGYGSCQELLLLQQYLDTIQPDLVIWQFCTNDFIDNYHLLEEQARYRNSLRRPYYYNGQVEYHTARTRAQQWCRYSKLFYTLYRLYHMALQTRPAEQLIAEQGMEYEPFKTSVEITEQTLARVQEVIVTPQTRLLLMCADYYEPHLSALKTITEKLGIQHTDAHLHQLHRARDAGKAYQSGDGVHWNAYGHQQVAESLVDYIKNYGLLD
jgi:lysophospholipase L1-like esterase